MGEPRPLDLVALREAILELPVHSISGYEWECDECHYHFSGHPCWMGHEVSGDGEFDSAGKPSSHGSLIDLDRVLALLTERDA